MFLTCEGRQAQGKGIIKKKCQSFLSHSYLMVSEGPKQFIVSLIPVNLETFLEALTPSFSARDIFMRS